jgi:AbrB family looped-hinge helix DNA binding protein
VYVRITSKRQVTFPAKVLDALGVGPGDQMELEPGPDGYVLRARRIHPERLAPLHDRLRRGRGSFDLDRFREEPHDPALRD